MTKLNSSFYGLTSNHKKIELLPLRPTESFGSFTVIEEMDLEVQISCSFVHAFSVYDTEVFEDAPRNFFAGRVTIKNKADSPIRIYTIDITAEETKPDISPRSREVCDSIMDNIRKDVLTAEEYEAYQ